MVFADWIASIQKHKGICLIQIITPMLLRRINNHGGIVRRQVKKVKGPRNHAALSRILSVSEAGWTDGHAPRDLKWSCNGVAR